MWEGREASNTCTFTSQSDCDLWKNKAINNANTNTFYLRQTPPLQILYMFLLSVFKLSSSRG